MLKLYEDLAMAANYMCGQSFDQVLSTKELPFEGRRIILARWVLWIYEFLFKLYRACLIYYNEADDFLSISLEIFETCDRLVSGIVE